MNKTNLTSLFLKESVKDSEKDFERALNDYSFPHFDVIAITASNEHQAQGFRLQLLTRKLPKGTEFIVIPDKNGERVGSGGATLSVIKYIKDKYGSFKGKSFAVIHSGGDGKRTPNYSALGKLFSPVPRILPNGKPSTLFDEFMISLASIPSRIREGMILLSGDVMLLFNPLQIDFPGIGAGAISFKESAQTGQNHGVFLSGEDGNVRRFLHKQSVETLINSGAVNQSGNVSIDTGALIFAPDLLESLYSLVSSSEGENKYINSVTRLSLYGDFLYPMASDSTLDDFYTQEPEGHFCEELREARSVLWNVLSKYRIKLMNLAPAKFIHFGTTREIMNLMNIGYTNYLSIGWSNNICSSVNENTAGYTSILSENSKIGNGCYIEYSFLHSGAVVGNNCLLSFVDVDNVTIPDNVVVHGLKQTDGKFVCRIYGINDNPKEPFLFGIDLNEIVDYLASKLSVETTALNLDFSTLWNFAVYPVCDTIREAVKSSLNFYNIVVNKAGDIDAWFSAQKKSLCSGFNEADSKAIIDFSEHMADLVNMEKLYGLIIGKQPVESASHFFKSNSLSDVQEMWLQEKFDSLDITNINDFSIAIRLYWYIGAALNNNMYKSRCLKTIRDTMLQSMSDEIFFRDSSVIKHDIITVNLPLRVNWGGGWTDTSPYCIENGGKVLNAAISLNGKLPVEVTLRKIPEYKIIFKSSDLDIYGEFNDMSSLQDTGNPYDSFALQKACLIACGIIPKTGGDLKLLLQRLGGGFEMRSEVTGVPKGSGLGTSSILSAACVKAVFEFTDIEYTEDKIYSCVFAMEQIMSTGGGWQDQVGGLTNGIKLITTEPGIKQRIEVDYISIPKEILKELNDRFCLIYTGQRRLARNLLRNVIGRYMGNDPQSVYAHNEIKIIADRMVEALESGDIDSFADLMTRHWELSLLIDEGTTNTLIDQILLTVNDYIDGKFVSGAGGGGFLQVILKKGVSKTDLHNRLKSVFQEFPVDVWECEII
ncbi:MAG: bifunctional fucokinase/L-fucose-1-P-guanylyltransferase [Clostridiales bacterium]|nr:bifunctional fucokinase/L-fucose-1-P-guanylyltransferase [Clostridiales bacterium]